VRLVLVGDFTGDVFYSSYPALRRLIGDLGVTDRVIFTGFVADPALVYFYNAAQALVLPSFGEGFGLPAVEAMACGIPVVASRIGALTEVVGEAGLFFDPRAPEELTERLRELLEDEPLRARLGRTGLVQARRFSWDRSAHAAREAFESVGRVVEPAPA
jgi:glycosyltransferase involved in cell wall biosynthesis